MTNKTGVYKITNNINGKFYYGSASETFKERWRLHKKLLRSNCHSNLHLQSAWNTYGADAFEFSIVLLCDPQCCLFYEQLLLDKYWDNGKFCYNISRSASAPMLGRKHTEQTIDKQSKIKIGKNNPMYGKTHSKETKQKMAEARKGKRNSPGTEFKTGAIPHNLGVIHSQESRKKISKGRTKFDKQIALTIINELASGVPPKNISIKTGKSIKIICAIKYGHYQWANDIIAELNYNEVFEKLRPTNKNSINILDKS